MIADIVLVNELVVFVDWLIFSAIDVRVLLVKRI